MLKILKVSKFCGDFQGYHIDLSTALKVFVDKCKRTDNFWQVHTCFFLILINKPTTCLFNDENLWISERLIFHGKPFNETNFIDTVILFVPL